jgi:hypothetical protein
MLSKYGYAHSEEEEAYETITVSQPLSGFHALGTPFLVPAEGGEVAMNVTFESLAIEKATGRVQIGDPILVAGSTPGSNLNIHQCMWGYQHVTKAGVRTLIRVNGMQLYKLLDTDPDPNLWRWVGAVSGVIPATADDVLGNGTALGTAVQKNDRIHYADGGLKRLMWIPGPPSRIVPWGSDLVLQAGTITGEIQTGGFLLSNRRYSFAYQLINADTGFKSALSPASNVVEIAGPGDQSQLAITIPKVENWTPDWSIIRIARSTGAVPPSDPAAWFTEYDIEGVENLDIYDHMGGILRILDGDLGTEITDTSEMIPRARYVLYDPNGDRCIAFGNPEDPNVMYWSEDGDFGSFPSTNQTAPIEDNDGDPLAGGAVLLGRIYLIKRRRGIFQVTPAFGGGYAVEKITNAVGCVGHHTIVTRGAALYWLSDEGAIEFVGQDPKNISDEKIRMFMRRIATSSKYVNAYACEERRSGSAIIHWEVKDPLDGGIYRLTFDLHLRAWALRRLASGDGVDPNDGLTIMARVLWHVLDDDDGDNSFHIYEGDSDGRCWRLGSDVDGTPVYHNGGADYTFEFKTPWFGNGLDTYVPRFLDFLYAVTPPGLNAGALHVSLYLDGKTAEFHGADYRLYDTDETDRQFLVDRFRCPSLGSPCTMFQFGFRHTSRDGAVKIPWYQVKLSVDAPRLRGHHPRGL